MSNTYFTTVRFVQLFFCPPLVRCYAGDKLVPEVGTTKEKHGIFPVCHVWKLSRPHFLNPLTNVCPSLPPDGLQPTKEAMIAWQHAASFGVGHLHKSMLMTSVVETINIGGQEPEDLLHK
jgi:hypothetical protein